MVRRRQQQQQQGPYLPLSAVEPAVATATEESSSTASSIQDDVDAELCEIGVNVVDQCNTMVQGTESKLSTSTNLAKCICGAGSFALPHVFLEEGVLGGTLAISLCGYLATVTMQSLSESKLIASAKSSRPVTSYVQLARETLGETAATIVFALTMSASLGVCSTYLVFIGQTLESMAMDETTSNLVRQWAPNVSEFTWEILVALILIPLSVIRDYSIFAFTSALGVFAVVGGIFTTLLYGIYVDPGGGLSVSLQAIETLPMWPSSLSNAFGGSFGTICYLFAINFLTFPIMNSMKNPQDYNSAIANAVGGVWIVNVAFAILTLGFFQDATQDIVLGNLDNGPYLSALKLLLVVDLLFTFPIVFSSGRQILTNALLGEETAESNGALLERVTIVAGAVGVCFALAQIGGFGKVANLVGGTAQGTLAFIMPPAISLALAADENKGEGLQLASTKTARDVALASFGVALVGAVTYFTFQSM